MSESKKQDIHEMLTEITMLQRKVKELMEKYPAVFRIDTAVVQMVYKPFFEGDDYICFRDIFGEGEVKSHDDRYIRHEAVAMGVKFIALEEVTHAE